MSIKVHTTVMATSKLDFPIQFSIYRKCKINILHVERINQRNPNLDENVNNINMFM